MKSCYPRDREFEYGINGARTWFCFLDPSTGAISTTYGGSPVAFVWQCVTDECYERCVAHATYTCVCDKLEQTLTCMLQGGSCTETGSAKE